MIVLDTNVVSEMMRPAPHQTVTTWLNDQIAETLYLSTITLAELMYGISAMPDGRRRHALETVFVEVAGLFGERILPFDTEAAQCYADLAVKARTAGRGFPTPDGYIASIAASKGYAVATRDSSPFQAAGVHVINPWQCA